MKGTPRDFVEEDEVAEVAVDEDAEVATTMGASEFLVVMIIVHCTETICGKIAGTIQKEMIIGPAGDSNKEEAEAEDATAMADEAMADEVVHQEREEAVTVGAGHLWAPGMFAEETEATQVGQHVQH